MGDATHGNSLSHRTRLHRPAAVARTRVKGKRMAGHMGDVRQTVQNLKW